MNRVFAFSLFIGAAAAAGGCSSSTTSDPPHPTQKQAAQEITSAICGTAFCDPTFKAKYNGSVQACVDAVVAAANPTDARDACTQAQVDQCAKDTNAMTCDEIKAAIADSSKQPASCKDC